MTAYFPLWGVFLLIGLALFALMFMKALANYQILKTKTGNKMKKGEKSMKVNIVVAVPDTLWALAIGNSPSALSA